MDRDLTIVTGGAGFIGSHLVDRLVRRGHRVRVVERPGADTGHLPPAVEVVRADIREREAVRSALAGARWVYHLAANPNLWILNKKEFEEINHLGAVNVLDAAIAAGAGRILHCSTESILTCARQVGPIDEDVHITEADAVGPYCLSKLRAERAAMERAAAGHLVVVANPTMPVGAGDRGLSPPTRLIRDFVQGRLPAYLECTLNVVGVRCVAAGLQATLERGRPGRRHLLGGENLTLRSLLRILSELTGRPVPRWRVPYPVGLAVAHVSEWWADRVSGRAPAASVTGLRLARRTMHFDSSRTWAELGLAPRPVREALAEAVAWLGADPRPPAAAPDRPATPHRGARASGGAGLLIGGNSASRRRAGDGI